MFFVRGLEAVANVQRFNIAAGAPPNFMLPPYQAGWTGHLASTTVSDSSRKIPALGDGHPYRRSCSRWF